jgi:hypothetical protein
VIFFFQELLTYFSKSPVLQQRVNSPKSVLSLAQGLKLNDNRDESALTENLKIQLGLK